MRKTLFVCAMTGVALVILLLLARTQPTDFDFDPEIPRSAQMTIWEDYLEWIHPPKWGGDCGEMPVVRVTWIEPRGEEKVVPVLWVKDADKYGAILGLSYSDLRYVERTVWAQPVIVLRNVSILRFCGSRKQLDPMEEEQESEEVGVP